MMKSAKDLSAGDRALVHDVHSALRRFGADPVVEARESEVKWVRKAFPHWKKSKLFPFILGQEDRSALIVPSYGETFVLVWFSPGSTMDPVRFATEPLLEHGYLPLGYDRGGNIIFLDTHSKDGLEIALYYFPRLAEGVSEEYIYRTGRSLLSFLDWVWKDPKAFIYCWDDHFSRRRRR